MSSPRPAAIHPDPAGTLAAAFLIQGRLAVRAVLRELMSRRVPVTLYPDQRLDEFAVARVLRVSDDEVEFDLGDQAPLARILSHAQSVSGVSFPGQVKTQLRLERFELLLASGGYLLRAAVPEALYRLQRRDAFRVTPPSADEARCVRRVAPEGEVHYALLDLSAGGLSVRTPAEVSAPALRTVWPHSRIETVTGRTIPCDLLVCRVAEDPDDSGTHRIGLAFNAVPSEVMRQIQLYVLEIEKRSRPA